MFNVVLVYPDIPFNTGNIGRLCVGLKSRLHLVKPLGFRIDDKYVKRAGLDYWENVDLVVHDNLDLFFEYSKNCRLIYASTKGKKRYFDYKYQKGDFLVFGSETSGLPEEIIYNNYENCVTIPMPGEVRSINLSNSVSIILYEAYRQIIT